MARVINSPLEGLSGTLGDLIFRTWNGKTFVNPKPNRFKKRKQSTAQQSTRTRFSEASFRAKLMLRDPAMREQYQRKALELKLPNAYTAALRDEMLKMA